MALILWVLKSGVYEWRREWDSNPRGISPKLISSQPRYDHFDTSPQIFLIIPKHSHLIKGKIIVYLKGMLYFNDYEVLDETFIYCKPHSR